jgi:glycerol kinase
MPTTRVTVVAVSDEGDTVIVWGRTVGEPQGTAVAFACRAKDAPYDADLAERASRLAPGAEIDVDVVPVVDGWNRIIRLSSP